MNLKPSSLTPGEQAAFVRAVEASGEARERMASAPYAPATEVPQRVLAVLRLQVGQTLNLYETGSNWLAIEAQRLAPGRRYHVRAKAITRIK